VLEPDVRADVSSRRGKRENERESAGAEREKFLCAIFVLGFWVGWVAVYTVWARLGREERAQGGVLEGLGLDQGDACSSWFGHEEEEGKKRLPSKGLVRDRGRKKREG
jgi:hypothetical protein